MFLFDRNLVTSGGITTWKHGMTKSLWKRKKRTWKLMFNPLSCSRYLFIQIIIQDTHSKPYLFWKAFSILTIVVHVHKISSLTHMHTHNTSTHINEHAYAYSLYLFIPIILFPFIFHAPCCILMRASVEAIKT